MHRIGSALMNIVLLWAAIDGAMVAAVPLLAWGISASAMNFVIWRLRCR
jgi:hypothetical protein